MKHALVVGGTGMLRGVSLELAKQYRVSVIARTKEDLDELVKETQGRVNPLCVDYNDYSILEGLLAGAVEKYGPISLAVVCVHSDAPGAPNIVAKYVGSESEKGRYVHVLGSRFGAPDAKLDPWRAKLMENSAFVYQETILGFVAEGKTSRWLNNEEIAGGVLAAIKANASRYVVGTLSPWSAKP